MTFLNKVINDREFQNLLAASKELNFFSSFNAQRPRLRTDLYRKKMWINLKIKSILSLWEAEEWCTSCVNDARSSSLDRNCVSSLTVCNVLKEDSTAVNGGSGWFSTFSKIPDPRSIRKAYSMFIKRIFILLTLFSVQLTWRKKTWYPGLKEETWYPGLVKSWHLSPRIINCTAASRFWQRTQKTTMAFSRMTKKMS